MCGIQCLYYNIHIDYAYMFESIKGDTVILNRFVVFPDKVSNLVRRDIIAYGLEGVSNLIDLDKAIVLLQNLKTTCQLLSLRYNNHEMSNAACQC